MSKCDCGRHACDVVDCSGAPLECDSTTCSPLSNALEGMATLMLLVQLLMPAVPVRS
jgi:hypothetical protein